MLPNEKISPPKGESVLLAIVTATAPKENRPFCSLRPYLVTKDSVGENPVWIYHVSKYYRRVFTHLCKHLQKKHPNLIYSEEIPTPRPPLTMPLFPKLTEIFTLTDQGVPRKFAILCEKGEKRLQELIKTISPFAQSVSLVTHHPTCFEPLCTSALQEYGLTVNQRDIAELDGTALTLLLSGEFPLSRLKHGYFINLSGEKCCASIPSLCDIAAKETEKFFVRHPHLRIPHFPLLPWDATITNLIWKYC